MTREELKLQLALGTFRGCHENFDDYLEAIDDEEMIWAVAKWWKAQLQSKGNRFSLMLGMYCLISHIETKFDKELANRVHRYIYR